MHAQLEGEAGESLSFGVFAQPGSLLFGDPAGGFHPRFALRDPLEMVTILHVLILAQDAQRAGRSGLFFGMGAAYGLDSEAYTWTDVPAPDDPF